MRVLWSLTRSKMEVLLRLQPIHMEISLEKLLGNTADKINREVFNLPHVPCLPFASKVTDETECIYFLTEFLSWVKDPAVSTKVKRISYLIYRKCNIT